jgi:NADPH-dependent curcumin reductase CurA
LVLAEIRARLAVSKRPVNTTDMDSFKLKKVNDEVKEQYQVIIKNRYLALEIIEDNGDINRL